MTDLFLAAHPSSDLFWFDRFFGTDDLENFDDRYRERKPYCSSIEVRILLLLPTTLGLI